MRHQFKGNSSGSVDTEAVIASTEMPEKLTQNDREQSIWCVGLRRRNSIGAVAMVSSRLLLTGQQSLQWALKRSCGSRRVQVLNALKERNIRWNWFESATTAARSQMTKLGNITATVGQMSGVLGAIDASVQSCAEKCQAAYLATKRVKCHINLYSHVLQT